MPENPKNNQLPNLDLYKPTNKSIYKSSPTVQLTNVDYVPEAADFGSSKYDDPNISLLDLQSGDYKYLRGEKQSGLAQLGLGALRAIGKAGVEIAKTPGYLYALGSAFQEDVTLDQALDNAYLNALEGLEDKYKEALPVYQSYKSGKGGLMDAITSTAFWGSDGADGVGYLLGMMGVSGVTGALGVGSKIAKLGTATKMLKTADKASKVASNLDLATQTLLNSSLEAMAEAKGVADDLKAKGVDAEKVADAAYNTFMANMGLLIIPNAIMNKNLLGSFKRDKSILDRFTDPVTGKLVSNPVVKKQVAKEYGKNILLSAGAEGFMEEGGQTAIQNYETNKALGKTNKGFIEGVVSEYIDMLGTTEGQKAVLLGSVLGSIGGVAGQYRENKAEQKDLPIISKLINNNYQNAISVADIYKRDEAGKPIVTDGKPEMDINKAKDYIKNLVGQSKTSQIKDLALLDDNKLLYDYIDNEEFTRWATPFLEQGEVGLQILDEHLKNVSKTAESISTNNPTLANVNKLDEASRLNNLRTKAKELLPVYESVSRSMKSLDYLYDTPNTTPAMIDSYINKVTEAGYQEVSKQLFLKESIKDLTLKVNNLSMSDMAELPQTQSEIERINKDILGLQNTLNESIESFKALYDPKEHKAALAEEIKISQDSQMAEEAIKEESQPAPKKTTPDTQLNVDDMDVALMEDELEQYYDEDYKPEKVKGTPKNVDNILADAMGTVDLGEPLAFDDDGNIITPEQKEATPETTKQPLSESDNIVSNATVNQLDSDVATKVDETVDANNDVAKNLTTSRISAVMMSLFNMNKNKTWERNKDGEVKKTNTMVSYKVNNPEYGSAGSTVELQLVKLDPINQEDYDKILAETRNSISKAIEKNPELYTEEDANFNSELLTAPIGIYQNGELLGFMPVPHYVEFDYEKRQDSEYIKAYTESLEFRKALIAERAEALKKIKNGNNTVKVADKGRGKLLTKIANGQPILEKIPSRDQDTFNGKSLYLYDNGESLTLDGDVESLFEDDANSVNEILKGFKSLSFADEEGNGIGRVYKAVQSANGSYSVIPVYTPYLNQVPESVNKVIDAVKNFTDYTDFIAEVNKYVFAVSIFNDKYSKSINAIKVNDRDGSLTIGSNSYIIDNLKQNIGLSQFKKDLATLKHNIAVKDINKGNYQSIMNDILTTNAYLDTTSGEFFVQPYIELEPLVKRTETPTEETNVSLESDVRLDTPEDDSDISNYNGIEDGDDVVFSRTKFEGNLVKSHKIISKILPGITIADVKEAAAIKPNIKDVYGLFRNMTIYLFEGATDRTAYHEAFHGVFRNLLSDVERLAILKEARTRYKAPTESELDDLRSLPGNDKLSDLDLEHLYYEERLSDEFAEYVDLKVNKTLGGKILDFFKKIVKAFNIFSKTNNESDIEFLFNNISTGKYAKASKLPNRIIDGSKYNNTAYSRISNNIKKGTEMDRIKSITDQYLAKYNEYLFYNDKISDEEKKSLETKIFSEIKEQYKKAFKDELAKPEKSQNKNLLAIASAVYNNFDSSNGTNVNFIDAVKTNLKFRQIKLTGNLTSVTEDIETGVNEDQSVQDNNVDTSQGNTTKGYGQEMTSISGVRSATHVVKLFLSSIPIIKDSKVELDNFGFPKYHDFGRLYFFLEKHLADKGSSSYEQHKKILLEASKYRPEYKQIIDNIERISNVEARDSVKKQFATNFSKQVLNYKLILFNKENNNFKFRILDPNRKNARRELEDKWTRENLQDPSNSVMDPYRLFNESDSKYVYNIEALTKLVNSMKDKTYTADEFYELSRSVGVDLDKDSFDLLYEKDKTDFKKTLESFITAIINNQYISRRNAIKALVNKGIIASTESFTSSFNNVENSVVYAIQNSSYASKLVSDLSKESTAAARIAEFEKDSFYKNNVVLASIKDGNELNMFYLDGLKPNTDSKGGKKFNQMHDLDFKAMALNMFANVTGNESVRNVKKALYTHLVPAEKSLSAVYEAPKFKVDLRDNGSVNYNSRVVDKFMDMFNAEADRIHKALLDKKNDIKPIPRYHYLKDSSKWDGYAYEFHNVDFFKSANNELKSAKKEYTKSIVKYLEENIDNPNAVNDMVNINPEAYKSVRQAITDSLTYTYRNQLNKFINDGIIDISNNTFTSRYIDIPNLTSGDIVQLVADYTINTWMFNANMSALTNGDPAFYKGSDDFGKRFYQSLSMLKYMDTSLINKETSPLLSKGSIKFNVIKDVEVSSKSGEAIKQIAKGLEEESEIIDIFNEHYGKENSINVTDAQVFVSDRLYKELKRAYGDLTTDLKPIKPFIYTLKWDELLKKHVPVQVKCSIMPITDALVKNNPLLKEHKNRMDKDDNYPQAIGFNSAFKALVPEGTGILSDTAFEVEVPTSSFGIQVDNIDHSFESENSSLRQLRMLYYGMLENDKQYFNGMTGSQIKEFLTDLESANLIESLEDLNDIFVNDRGRINTIIKEAVSERGATSIIEKLFEVGPDGNFKYSIDLGSPTQVIQMISSLYTKRTVLQKFRGGSHVQASSIGYGSNLLEQQKGLSSDLLKIQTSLEWIKADPNNPNSIDYVDIALPAHAEKFKDFINPDGTIKDNMPEELRKMIVYRIPYEGAHSTMVARVKYFLPEEHGNVILMPYEVTKQFGADFDFDKTFFIMKDYIYSSKKDKFIIPKYTEDVSNLENRYDYYVKDILRNNKDARRLVSEARKDAEEANEIAKLEDEGYEIYNYSFKDDVSLLESEGYIVPFDVFKTWSIPKQNGKIARNNMLVDIYDNAMRNKNMLKSLISPSGPGKISKVYDKVKSKIELDNYFTPDHQSFLKYLFHSVSRLKGLSALHVTGHSWVSKKEVSLNNPVKVLNHKYEVVPYSKLNRITSDANEKIAEELSSMMATILDAVKVPDQLPSIGINEHSIDTWATLVRLGLGTELASSITSQRGVKEYFKGLENNYKQLKGDTHKNFTIDDVLTKYKDLYSEFYSSLEDGDTYLSKEYNKPDNINNSSLLLLNNIETFTRRFEDTDVLVDPNSKVNVYERLEFLKTQIQTLNMVKGLEAPSKALKTLNNFFNINKEVGPNFEDINGKLEMIKNLELEPSIDGLLDLLNDKLIRSYVNIHDSARQVVNSHFMFASNYFNGLKEQIAYNQYKERNIIRIKTDDRNIINNFIRTFIDAGTTYENMFRGEEDITDTEFVDEIFKILVSGENDTHKYKLFGNRELTLDDKAKLRNTVFLNNIEVGTIPNSGKKYIKLKGNRLELFEKERMIESLNSLYSNSLTKKLAEGLVKHAFKTNGYYTGLNSYAPLIDPDIHVAMGLQDMRTEVKNRLSEGRIPFSEANGDRIVDQLIRNYPKKFTRIYDNESNLFSENKDGSLTLDPNTKVDRSNELIVRDSNGEVIDSVSYIRYINKDKEIKLYKLNDTSLNDVGAFVYEPISMLGYEGLYVELNPFNDLTESELPNNNYKAYTKKVKTTEGKSKAVPMSKYFNNVDDTNNASIEQPDKTEPKSKYSTEQEFLDDMMSMEDVEPIDLMSLTGMTANTPLVSDIQEDLDKSENIPTFENSFTEEERNTILGNFTKKFNMSLENAIKMINSEIARKPVDAINKLKECYL